MRRPKPCRAMRPSRVVRRDGKWVFREVEPAAVLTPSPDLRKAFEFAQELWRGTEFKAVKCQVTDQGIVAGPREAHRVAAFRMLGMMAHVRHKEERRRPEKVVEEGLSEGGSVWFGRVGRGGLLMPFHRWLTCLALLADGLAGTLTLGLWRLDLSTAARMKYLVSDVEDPDKDFRDLLRFVGCALMAGALVIALCCALAARHDRAHRLADPVRHGDAP